MSRAVRGRSSRLVLAAALAAAFGCNRVATAPAGPSVLLVTVDTLRADHVGAYGAAGAHTPHLDALAAEGVLFETAVAPVPVTLPSHASILTGLWPPHHGVRHNGLYQLGDEHETLAERLHAAGWATGAVVGAAVLDPRHGLDQGFDDYDADFSRRSAETGFAERDAAAVTDAALAWLDAHREPFFLWVHYYDPHAAYRPPSPWRERFADRPYDGEIAYVDAELGRLFAALRRRGAWERSVVAVTADHGESLGEHGESDHAYTLYDAALRVPLLLRGPGIPAGRRLAGPVTPVDLAPTLLAAAGRPVPQGLDGRDLQRAWAGGAADPDRVLYAETLATEIDHGWAPLFAARSAEWLYVQAPRPELYDVRADPAQQHDRLAGNPDDPALRREVAALEASIDGVRAAARPATRVDLDEADRARLRALGYVADDAPAPRTGMDPKDGLPLLRRFVAAERAYAADRLDEALALARALREEMASSPRLLNLLARIHLARQEPVLALEPAERAVALVPGSARHREMLGDVRLAAGDVAGAVADFEAAVALDPGQPWARAGLMWKRALGGSLEEAARNAQAALAGDPTDLALALQVAEHWDRLGEYDRALEAYRAVLARAPGLPAAHAGAALQQVRFGDDAAAREHLERAGAAARAPAFQLRLAVAYAGRGERDRAAELLRALVARHPDWPAPRAVLARVQGRGPG